MTSKEIEKLFCKDYPKAKCISMLYGKYADKLMEKTNLPKHLLFTCKQLGKNRNLRICVYCEERYICVSMPSEFLPVFSLLCDYWHELSTLTDDQLIERKNSMARVRKSKADSKGTGTIKNRRTRKAKTSEPAVDNGMVQTFGKLVQDACTKVISDILEEVNELSDKVDKLAKLPGYMQAISDRMVELNEIAEKSFGADITVMEKNKGKTSRQKQVAEKKRRGKSKDKESGKTDKLSSKDVLVLLEDHLHETNDVMIGESDVNDEENVFQWVNDRSSRTIKADSLKEYILRPEHHKVSIDTLAVYENEEQFGNEWFAYCDCIDCKLDDEENVFQLDKVIDEKYFD